MSGSRRGFTAHPPTIEAHANRTEQRADAVTGHARGLGSSTLHPSALGNLGAGTGAHANSTIQRASAAVDRMGARLRDTAGTERAIAGRYRDNEESTARLFRGGDVEPKSVPKGAAPTTTAPTRTAPTTTPAATPTGPFAGRPWFGNTGFTSSQADRDKYAAEYPEYGYHENELKNDVLPHHPELAGMPIGDLVGVRGYTTNDYYSQVNTALRNGDQATVDRYDAHIRTAVSGLNQLPSYNGDVARGITIPDSAVPGVLDRYRPGETVTENAFTSSSVASSGANFPGNVVFHMHSVNGRDVANASEYPTESEVLFAPGTRFDVTDRYNDPATNTWHIHMNEVP